MKQAAFRGTAPPMGWARKSQAPGACNLYTASNHSHKSCPTSSCDSCFGLIYEDGYDYESNSEELDDDADEDVDDYGSDGWDQSQSQSQYSQSQASSICPTPVAGHSHSQVTTTDPFSMSSMSSLFGPSSWSSSSPFSQQSQGHSPFGAPVPAPAPTPTPTSRRPAPPLPAPLGSRRNGSRSSQRCSCQKSSNGFSNAFSSSGPPPPGGTGNGQSQGTTTDTQLSIFTNSQHTGTDNQTQTDSQALGHLLINGPGAKGKNGKGMVKNLNVYNPNITIQVTPEHFSQIFPGKKSGGQRSGNVSSQK